MRDYKYSGDIFKGFEKEGTENSIDENRQDYMNRLKDSFLNYPFVLSHFENPEKVGTPLTVNSDGSDLIIDKLLPSANNIVKINNSVKRCNIIKDEVLECLNKYYVSEDKEERREIR